MASTTTGGGGSGGASIPKGNGPQHHHAPHHHHHRHIGSDASSQQPRPLSSSSAAAAAATGDGYRSLPPHNGAKKPSSTNSPFGTTSSSVRTHDLTQSGLHAPTIESSRHGRHNNHNQQQQRHSHRKPSSPDEKGGGSLSSGVSSSTSSSAPSPLAAAVPASTIGVITPVSVENSTFVPPPPPPPPPPPSLPSSSPPDGAAPAQPPSVPPLTVEKANRWQFTDKDCARSASRRDGMSAEDELLCRSKAVAFLDGLFCRINNLYQKGRGRMGTGILCTAIIHLQRFYYFHSFSGPLDYRDVAAAILFLTAKLEEIPHKLEEVTTQWWHQKHPRADPALLTTARLENGKQLLMFLENMVLQTIGFDVSVELPQSIALQQIMLLSKSGQRGLLPLIACNTSINAEVADKIKDATVFFTTELIALTDWALRYTPRQIATVAFKIVLLWSQFETAVPDSFLRDIDPTVPPEHLDYMVGTYVSSRQRQREVLPTLESIMQRNQFLSSTRQRGLQLAIKSSGGDGAWRPSSTTILPPPPPPPPPSLLPPSLSASPAPRSTTAVQRGPPPPPPPPSNHNQQQSQKQQQSNPNVAENPIKKLGLAEYKERQHQTQNAQQSKSAPPPPQPDKYKLNPPPPPPPSLMSGLGSGSSGRRDREQRTQHHGYQHHQSRHRDHDVAREHERKRSHEQKDEPPRESKRARPTSGISPPSNGLTTTTSSGAHVSAALPLNGLQRVTEDDLEDGEVP